MQTQLSPQFATLPAHAKVWIWQSVQPLDAHMGQIATLMDEFVSGWLSHGAPIVGAWQVLHGHFIVVSAVTQDGVSGCSTDGLQRTIQQVAQTIGLDLHNRMKAGLISEDGKVEFLPLKQVRNGELDAPASAYRLFDLTVSSMADLRTGWPVPLVGSWAEPRGSLVKN